jgi:hypothetical protein
MRADAARLFDDLAGKAFRWLEDHRHPESGMVKDRAGNFEGRGSGSRMSSIASTGYHLSLLPYAVSRGWVDAAHAREEARQSLRFATNRLGHHHGLLYHFIDWETGRRWEWSEFALLDTAIFLNGCMVAAEAFDGVEDLADPLLDRVDWAQYLLTHPRTGKPLLSFGWSPDGGGRLLSPADVRSSELAMAYFLATGSRAHPIDPEVWYNTAVVTGDVCGYRILNPAHALFTSYYGLGWADLRGLVDREEIDLDANAREAALANRAYCHSVAARRFATYRASEGGWWGLSAGDGPAGYVARGPGEGDPHGTVWPTAALAAVPWAADVLAADLLRWRASPAWGQAAGKYGLSPFSLDRQWLAGDVIGIDLGSYAVNWANHSQGAVWELWMRHPVAQNSVQRLGYSRRQS